VALHTLRLLCAALATLALLPAAVAHASGAPFVFVKDKVDPSGIGLAWWAQEATVRPMGTRVSGVPLKQLNEKVGDGAWCYADAFTPGSFISASRKVQAEIDSTMREARKPLFRASGPFTGGAELDAVVGSYEGCDGTAGTFILITDRTRPQPNVVYVEAFPKWQGLAWIAHEADGLTLSSCFECGHLQRLYYDKGRKRFYSVIEGE
jgi:hypothetical protein